MEKEPTPEPFSEDKAKEIMKAEGLEEKSQKAQDAFEVGIKTGIEVSNKREEMANTEQEQAEMQFKNIISREVIKHVYTAEFLKKMVEAREKVFGKIDYSINKELREMDPSHMYSSYSGGLQHQVEHLVRYKVYNEFRLDYDNRVVREIEEWIDCLSNSSQWEENFFKNIINETTRNIIEEVNKKEETKELKKIQG